MKPQSISDAFGNAESAGFLSVPIPVPPMIEQAFRYRGKERYVGLGFSVHGGVMSDFVGDAMRPRSKDLYQTFLLHPAIKPYTDAFQIETEPPRWLEGMDIEVLESHRKNDIEKWWSTSRCLLLDRKERQFFVGTVSEIGNWLTLGGVLRADSPRVMRPRPQYSKPAEQALIAWLAAQPVPVVPQGFLEAWDGRFRDRLAIEACTGAAFKLGFEADDVRSMMRQAFGRGSRF